MKKTFELLLLILFQKSKNIFKFKSLKVKRAKLGTLNFFIFSNSNIKQLLTTMFHSRAYFIIFPTELFCLSAYLRLNLTLSYILCTDICDIAENLGFKADNIKNVKDHVFYQKHELDQYVSLGEASEYKRFDPYIQQALAWKRLETGTHTQDDITWIKHECAERHHELKYGSGYSEAHNRAQTHFDGAPWENNF